MYTPTTFADVVIVYIILAAIFAFAAFVCLTEKKAAPLSANELAELAALRASVAFAISDCELEYIAACRNGYSNRDARAQVRAYIHAKYAAHSDTVQREIARKAIQQGRARLEALSELDMIDVNDPPQYSRAA